MDMLAIYARISQEKEQGKDRSINDQTKLGIELAKQLDIPYKIYKDEGVSGTLPIDKRPAFSTLIDDITNGDIDKVYVYDQSRLERSVEVRFVIKKIFRENDIELYTDNGKVDLQDEQSEFFGDLLSVINSYYVKITKRKVKSVMRRLAAEGKSTGKTPYGFGINEKNELIIDTQEAGIIKQIYKLRKQGWGEKRISEYLNENNIPTRYNKMEGNFTHINKYTKEKQVISKKNVKWSHSTVRRILENPIYKGEREYGGGIYKVPVIIPKQEWSSVNKKKSIKGRVAKHQWLLNNILMCGVCNKRYVGRDGQHKAGKYYMCVSKQYKNHTCSNRNIQAPMIEEFIWSRFFVNRILENKVQEYLESGNHNKSITEADTIIEQLNKQIKELEKKKQKAIELTIEGIISKEEITTQLNTINNKIEGNTIELQQYQERKVELLNSNKKLQQVKDIQLITSYKGKHEILHRYIKAVTILYEEPYYNITVEFNIEGVMKDNYKMDRRYRVVLDDTGNAVFGRIWLS